MAWKLFGRGVEQCGAPGQSKNEVRVPRFKHSPFGIAEAISTIGPRMPRQGHIDALDGVDAGCNLTRR